MRPHVLVVTGMSGAGRSTAAKVLEDLGYNVIDNLPPELLSQVGGPPRGAGAPAATGGGHRFAERATPWRP